MYSLANLPLDASSKEEICHFSNISRKMYSSDQFVDLKKFTLIEMLFLMCHEHSH